VNGVRATTPDPAVDDLEDRLRRSVESMHTGARRVGRSQKLGPQAEATRRRLAVSARALFRQQGCTRTTVADIAAGAEVSLGTFYQYFEDVHDVTALVVVDFIRASLASELDRWDSTGGEPALRGFLDRFLRLYVANAELLELWETGKLVSPRLRALYQDYYRVYRARLEECVLRGVEAGAVRDDVPADRLADLLATLTERYCYEHFVLLGEKEVGDGVDVLTAGLVGLLHLTGPTEERIEE
jgi:AcrR family transcriptional regulator